MTTKTTTKATKSKPTRKSARPVTKVETILSLVKRANGASLGALEKATGWQPHSIRAALTGLRKKGHAIERDKDAKGASVYRVAE